MKLPKGVKKLKVEGSAEALKKAIVKFCTEEFNGYIRVTAPKGVRKAGIVLFLQGLPHISVYQSADRSLYGADALPEIKKLADLKGSVVRVEEFFAHTLEEVDKIVTKMAKAMLTSEDLALEDLWKGPPAKPAPKKPIAPEEDTEALEAAAPAEEEEPQKPEALQKKAAAEPKKVVTEEEEPVEEAPAEGAPPEGAPAPKAGGEDFLTMLKEVGLSPAKEDKVAEDEVDQYIAAFESFLHRPTDDGAAVVKGPPPEQVQGLVDDLISEMSSSAQEDPAMLEFIESQRSRLADRLAESTKRLSTVSKHRDTLTEQRDTLQDISRTFRDVFDATQKEAEKRRTELERRFEEGEGDEDWFEHESTKLDHQSDRFQEIQDTLSRVLTAHQERLEGAEEELEEAKTETHAEVKRELVDLEKLKEDFLTEMRDRIQDISETKDKAEARIKAAKTVRSISEGIQDRVEELEHEKTTLAEEHEALEAETQLMKERRDTIAIDQEVEVEARLRDLEEREEALTRREENLLEQERHLDEGRKSIEEELQKARDQQAEVQRLEEELRTREEQVKELETKLSSGDERTDEIESKIKELEGMENKLRAREMELMARETELDQAADRAKTEREGEVEAELARVHELEEELKAKEQLFTSTQDEMGARIEELMSNLEKNEGRVKELEERLQVLQDVEEKARKLEEKLEAGAAESEAAPVDADDLRKMLSYIDDLLGHLPDKKIEDFIDSEYAALYNDILDKLGI